MKGTSGYLKSKVHGETVYAKVIRSSDANLFGVKMFRYLHFSLKVLRDNFCGPLELQPIPDFASEVPFLDA